MMKNDMILSLDGETFAGLKKDFDTILARTLGNMEMKGAGEATITLKLGVSLEKSSVGNGNGGTLDVTKPTFKHDITSVMQVKDKMSGQFDEDYAVVWDEESESWILRKINRGQMNIFDDEELVVADYYEVKAIEAGNSEETEIPKPPFEWLSQFADGEELSITEAMGNYTVRTLDNKVVLSSATSEDSPFYCPADSLKNHVGHKVSCVSVGYDNGDVTAIIVECEDCDEVIYKLDAPDELDADNIELLEEVPPFDQDFEEDNDAEEYLDEDDDEEEYEYENPDEE